MIRAALVLIILAGPAFSAGSPDPDWPCIQRRMPELSVAQVWTGPLPDESTADLAKQADIQKLAQVISLRRTTMDDVEKLAADFAQTASEQELVALFEASFDHIQKARDRVMAGITRYAHKQAALEVQIEEMRNRFATLMAEESKDFDAIDKTEIDLEWSIRIFKDRQQALTFVCDTPVILEKRAFSIGRIIAGHLPK